MNESRTSTHSPSLHASALVCDIVVPLVRRFDTRLELLARLRSNGCDFASLTMSGDVMAQPGEVFLALALARRDLLSRPAEFIIAQTAEDVRRAKRDGVMAVNFHFQGSEAVARELALVEAYYQLGVRFMLIAYNTRNSAGTGCMEEKDDGLSPYGRRLVQEMNRVGMIVDVSHCGYRTSMEGIEASTRPCMFSHSNVAAVRAHRRNVTDDQIRALAGKDGIIGVNGVGAFLDDDQVATVETLKRHIDHISQLVGSRHVGLGMDFIAERDREVLYAANATYDGLFGMGFPPPWNFLAPEDAPRLTEALLRGGYSEADVRGILGENFLRVAAANWR